MVLFFGTKEVDGISINHNLIILHGTTVIVYTRQNLLMLYGVRDITSSLSMYGIHLIFVIRYPTLESFR